MSDVADDDQRGAPPPPANWRATTLALGVGIALYWWMGWNVLSIMAFFVGFGGSLVNLYVDLRNHLWAKRRAAAGLKNE